MHIVFNVPGIKEREQIWKLLSKSLPLKKDVNFYELSNKYEFSGGHIKNAILNAARIAISTKKDKISQKDYLEGCNLVKEGRTLILQDLDDKSNLNYLG